MIEKFEVMIFMKSLIYRFKLNDEWIRTDSSRLRIPTPIQYKEGDRCLARWTDSRKFPATVRTPMENSKFIDTTFETSNDPNYLLFRLIFQIDTKSCLMMVV